MTVPSPFGVRRTFATLAPLIVVAACLVAPSTGLRAQRTASGTTAASELASITPNTVMREFKAVALYADAADHAIGARFIHQATGFTLDIVRQQSVPQAFTWVNTFPMNDRGEPHTQEHLLVGKGTKGRALGTTETASLATSGAFTQQWRTAYMFNTSAGPRAFYSLLDTELDALLNPDFSDEEIRREVRNFGISEDPATHALRLEEKGSVYNEMTTSTTSPFSRLFREVGGLVYGREHPLARNSGGTPEGIRELGASDIRAFHRSHYFLGNMGMIIAAPDQMPLDDMLQHMDALMRKYNRGAGDAKVVTMADMPAPIATPPGTIRIATFPHRNPQQPGPMILAWPATLSLSVEEETLASLVLDAFAGDASTTLYKKFVDTKTRTMDIGAKSVFGGIDNDQGFPVTIGLGDVQPAHLTEADIAAVRDTVLSELRRVAALPDGSPELQAFNTRVKSRIVSSRRALSKFTNSPPGFGFRGTGGGWLAQLDEVNRTPGFRKSLVLAPALAWADSVVSGPTNPWRRYLPAWHLTTVVPFGVGSRPDPSLIEKEERERIARASAEVARLRTKYGVSEDQEAIRRYQKEYADSSAALERLASSLPRTKLVSDLPMTLDDQLRFRVDTVAGVPVVSSTFESMSSATTGLALRLDAIPDDELVYLAAMPGLLTRVGVVINGTPLSYEAMSERQRREILFLGAAFSTNVRTGRAELVLRGAGNDIAESQRAIEWMRTVVTSPDWRPENLSRIRDVVDQTLASLRNTQQSSPESWVQGVATSYRGQDNPLILTAASFLTRTHQLQRLRWLLKDAGDATTRAAVDAWLAQLASAADGVDRASLQAMLRAITDTGAVPATLAAALAARVTAARGLTGNARTTAIDAARDLQQNLGEIPDGSLAVDWRNTVEEIRLDLGATPETALSALNDTRRRLLRAGNARAFITSSSATRRAVEPALRALLGSLDKSAELVARHSTERVIDARLRAREPGAAARYVGLLDQNMQGGVFLYSVPMATYADTSRRAITRVLAAKLYGGGGAHSIFSQTIAAGLAYSNGIGGSPTSGRLSYYAERTPELPQTLSFVIDQLKKSPHDTTLLDYATALVFSEVRSGADFEARGEGMASDVADGVTPASVRRFRQRVLDLRRTSPRLGRELYTQMDSVYAELLPGYWPGERNVRGAVYLSIGAEKQLNALDAYLKSAVSPTVKLDRLYGRDFWMRIAPRTLIP